MSKKLSNKEFYLNITENVAEICKPLLEFNINYFDLTRIYLDNTSSVLCNHSTWLHHFFEKNHAIQNPMGYQQSGFYLWDTRLAQEKMNFDIGHGITLVESQSIFFDIYNFASNRTNIEIFNLYLNQQEIFVKFILYFKTRAAKLLKRANGYRLNLAIEKNNYSQEVIKPTERFCEDIALSRYQVEVKGIATSITRRELDCLSLLRKGYTGKEVARRLNISYRTVEYYLRNLREKTGCKSKNQLIECLSSSMYLG